MEQITVRTMLLVLALTLIACGGGGDGGGSNSGPTPFTFAEPWPADMSAVYTITVNDTVDDLEIAPGGAPPYMTDYPPVDVVGVSLGVDGDFLYVRFDFNAALPTGDVTIPDSPPVEAQIVENQSISVNFNSDGDLATGAGGEGIDGIDIFFALVLEYGFEYMVYTNFGFPDGDIHHHQGHAEGELGDGGPGFDYAVLRFRISDFSAYFPRGETLEFGGWSEAESTLYHHFAFDPWTADFFDVPL